MKAADFHPGSVQITSYVQNHELDLVEALKEVAILWPWDVFNWMWRTSRFEQWVANDAANAWREVADYWEHCKHLDFYRRLQLQDSEISGCAPLFFHADGVNIYNQKAWVYSCSSSCRKGASTKTKLVLLLVREARPSRRTLTVPRVLAIRPICQGKLHTRGTVGVQRVGAAFNAGQEASTAAASMPGRRLRYRASIQHI